MIVVDLNLLLYAVNTDAPHHGRARAWWEGVLVAEEPAGLAWVVVLGFLRIATNPRILPRPIKAEQALEVVEDWLAGPPVRMLEPTERHRPILADLLRPLGAAGNLTMDAHVELRLLSRRQPRPPRRGRAQVHHRLPRRRGSVVGPSYNGPVTSKTTPAERLRVALDMHDEGVALMRQNLKRRHPDADAHEIERRLLAWLHERPGAEHGDGEGRPRA